MASMAGEVQEATRPQESPASPAGPPVLAPALVTAGLLWLCYFPADCGWLAWVALVPLLVLVRSPARPWRVYLAAWAGGLAFYWPVLQWMRVADPRMYATWAILATYCATYVPLAVWLLRRLDRGTRLPPSVTLPLVWTALEYVRAHLATGFPWYFLGHTQHDALPVIQVADLGGAYAVTFLVAAVNGLLFEVLYRRARLRSLFGLPDVPARWPGSALQAAGVGLLLAATVGYGYYRLGQADFADGPRVALIQGNLDQRIRNQAAASGGAQAMKTMLGHYTALCDQAAAQQPKPALLVWPETSHPDGWGEMGAGFPRDRLPPDLLPADGSDWPARVLHRLNAALFTAAAGWRTDVLFGVNTDVAVDRDRVERYNSAVLVRPDGSTAGRYDKMHRVPFGEYVPLRDWLPWMNAFAPYDSDYSIRPGETYTRFPLGAYRFGVIICYEDTDPSLARQYVAPGAEPVDFLLNLSNDGWFDGSSEHEQHLAICRFRAVECRRSVARAVNMGISAVIDPNGRVTALPGPTWAASKKVAGVVTAAVPIDRRGSLYAAWGDWLPAACWLMVGAGLLGGWWRRP
jgi:apolipoprotein N-acyltransferase